MREHVREWQDAGTQLFIEFLEKDFTDVHLPPDKLEPTFTNGCDNILLAPALLIASHVGLPADCGTVVCFWLDWTHTQCDDRYAGGPDPPADMTRAVWSGVPSCSCYDLMRHVPSGGEQT